MSKPNSKEIKLFPIGSVHANEEEGQFWIQIEKKYRPAMLELDQYSHIHVIWFAHQNDTAEGRGCLQSEELPDFYGDQAPPMGVFANRSEFRPNPIAITICPILNIDHAKGLIFVPWLDAFPGSPVVDIKPYIPMSDFVKSATVPPYLSHWPKSMEDAQEWWAKRFATQDGS